jgi:uncharacterized protein YfaS (alpha-2-macroglobulin family)
MRPWALVVFCVGLGFVPGGCSSPPVAPSAATPLPAVSPLARQPLPGWIASVSPSGSAQGGAQIRIRFNDDVVPVEALEAPDKTAALAHFSTLPALPGRFTFLTPRMVGFEADAPFPHASRILVTLAAGLTDLKGHRLEHDYAWTFETQPIELSGLPGSDRDVALEPVGLQPVLAFDSNVALDEGSLLAHARLVDPSDAKSIIALAVKPEPAPSPSAAPPQTPFAEPGAHYELVPSAALARGRTYRFVIDPGVAPAHGNVPSGKSYDGRIQTYGDLTLKGAQTDSSGDRFAKGSPQLAFSNPIDPGSVAGAVGLSPSALPSVALLNVADGSSTIDLNPYALQPRTHYDVSVASTVKDAFGQTLGKAASASFDTGELLAGLWAPTGFNIFPAGTDVALNVETTNLPAGRYRSAFTVLHPEQLIAKDPGDADAVASLLPAPGSWSASAAPAQHDRSVESALSLRQKLGGTTGLLAYGVTAKTYQTPDQNGKLVWQEPQFFGAVQLTDIGLFAQWFPEMGLVRASRLSDGTPLAHASIAIYESNIGSDAGKKPPATPCASGQTGADGMLTLAGAAFAACASTATESGNAPELLVVARNGADWSFVRTLNYSGAYGYGDFYAGWSAGAPNAHGTIVSDRSLYQQGETAEFTGVAYFETNGVLGRGRSASYDLALRSPSGKSTPLGTRTLDPFGAFSVEVRVDKAAELGYYTLTATGQRGEQLTGEFRVAQFRPPNFKVDLTLDRAFAAPGTSVSASSQSTYLFGAPLEGGSTRVYVTRRQAYFTPNGWDAYSFGRSWSYPEEAPTVTTDVLQTTLALDAQGRATVPVPVATGLPYAMTYQVDAETTDVSNLSVADSKTFTALPSDALIGLRSAFVATAVQPFALSAIVTDAQGKPLDGRKLTLVLQRREFVSATQIVEGSETPHDAVHYVEVARSDVTPGSAPATATFTAPSAGSYRVRANFSDAASETSASDQDLWITGPGKANWGSEQSNALAVKLDKSVYRPGATATALIASPYADAELYFAVIRHGVLYTTTQLVHGSAPQIRFTVTPQMLPNAAVEAVLVRRGTPLAKGVPNGLDKLARIGFATFNVALDAKYVNVEIVPAAASLEPGVKQTLRLRVRDRDGKPVRGELTVAVVNDSVLQLTGYRFPDLVKLVYSDQPISTRFADNRADVRLATEHRAVDKGFGFGGGAMAGPANTRVRTQFKPLAYWNAGLRTGADGEASVSFALPDDLTTWRVMALALTADARFGNGESSFISTKPLVTNEVLPQFARPGDRFSGGVAVTNVARASGQAAIAGTLGGGLAFAHDGTSSRTLSQTEAAGGLTEAYRFDMLVTGTSDATVNFSTQLGGHSDAFSVDLPIVLQDVTESVVTTGTTADTASVPLAVAPEQKGPLGGLELTLASTLLADVAEPARALDQPRPPFAEALASRIAIAADEILLDRRYGRAGAIPSLEATLAGDLTALRALQLPDDGYAAWPGAQRSEIFSTAFVATQLAQARSAGIAAGPDIARVTRFLHDRLANPRNEGYCLQDAVCQAEIRLEALETLGNLGEVRSDFLSEIVSLHQGFGYYEQVELARQLVKLPAWHAQGIALRDKLLEQLYLTGRRASVNLPGGFFESQPAGQAQAVGLLIETKAPLEDVDRAVRSLLELRKNGQWGCACDDAEALNALVLYAGLDATPPDFVATAQLPTTASRTLRETFQGYARTTASTTVPLDDLRRGAGRVVLAKRGTGTLHYVVAFRYPVPSEGPGVYSGIRIDRYVRAANATAILAGFGLATPSGPVTLAPAHVYDIEDRIVTDHPLDGLVVTDPLPAGLEAVDQTFRTATKYFTSDDAWDVDYQTIERDRVLSFAHHLEAGVYAIHYLARTVTPGTFAWPAATAQLQREPEEFGRTASAQLVVSAK